MSKFWKIVLMTVGFLLLFSVILFVSGVFTPQQAGIQIETTPSATVYIDGTKVGKTPYEVTRKAGEIDLKLVPESETPLIGLQTKVLLSPGIKTVVHETFGETEATTYGEIISFEKTGESEASLAVVSDPDSAQVAIDGTARGFAPYKTSGVGKGTHQIAITAPRYLGRTITVNTVAGYKLVLIIKLATDSTAAPETVVVSTPTPTPVQQIMIEILQTPNGFLRVREQPDVTSKEVARVDPGKKYLLVEEDPKSGWFKIEYLAGQSGWVSDEFAKKAINPP